MLRIQVFVVVVVVLFSLLEYKNAFFPYSTQIDEVQGAHSALHLACHEGHCDIIRELIDRGASREILVKTKICRA